MRPVLVCLKCLFVCMCKAEGLTGPFPFKTPLLSGPTPEFPAISEEATDSRQCPSFPLRNGQISPIHLFRLTSIFGETTCFCPKFFVLKPTAQRYAHTMHVPAYQAQRYYNDALGSIETLGRLGGRYPTAPTDLEHSSQTHKRILLHNFRLVFSHRRC